MGCKLTVSVVQPSKSPLGMKKTLNIPKSPILANSKSSDISPANRVTHTSDESESDSDAPPDKDDKYGSIFSDQFQRSRVP